MKFDTSLIQAKFLKRYKRFFADIELDGNIEVAHVANTGSLKSVNHPNQACLVSRSTNPERKLKFTLEAIKSPHGGWVGVNTSYPNKLVQEAFEMRIVSEWAKYDRFQSEVKLNSETRIDAVMWSSKIYDGSKINSDILKKYAGFHIVEIKNVSLAEVSNKSDIEHKQTSTEEFLVAKFPDAVTERGQKHIRELMELIKMGHTVELVFTIQRSDVKAFTSADEIDPEYGRLLREATDAGLILSPYIVDLSEDEIKLRPQKLEYIRFAN